MGSRVGLLVAALLAFATPAVAQQQPAPTVQGVELHLPEGFVFSNADDEASLPGYVAVRRGQPLSKRAVRRSLERLFSTELFADAVAEVTEVEGGVVVVFRLTPRRKISVVNVDGEAVLSEAEIKAKAGLGDGRDFHPELLSDATAAVREAYQQRGYFATKVVADTEETSRGLEVTLTIDEGAPTRISSIAISGSPGLPLTRILRELGIGPGAVLNQEAREKGLQKLKEVYRQERFYRARLGDPVITRDETGTKAAVALPISAGPTYAIHFHGNRSMPDALLRTLLRYDGSETLDRALTGRLSRRLENFYRYRGFHDVKVKAHEQPSPTFGRAVLGFDIYEGQPLRVQRVEFNGNERVPTAQLRAVLTDTLRSTAPELQKAIPTLDDPLEVEGRVEGATVTPPDPEVSTVFVEEAYQQAASSMEALYRERGFLGARVKLAETAIDVEPRLAAVRFDVTEGPQTLVKEIVFVGAPDEAAARAMVTLKVGAPLALSQVDASRSAVFRVFGRQGYLFARVEPDIRLSEDRTQATVALMVESGPQVRVGSIIIKGLNRTQPYVVRDNLKLAEGDVMDPESLFESQRALILLSIFRSVNVSIEKPDIAEPIKDITIEVRERPRLEGDVAGGYFLVDGPRILGTLAYTNVGGVGINLTARGKLNYIGASIQAFSGLVKPEDVQGVNGLGGRGNASIIAPRGLGPLPEAVSARLDLIGEREFRPSYRFTRFAAVVGADYAARRWLDVSLQYEIEHTRVFAPPGLRTLLTSLSRANEERLRFPIGLVSLQTVRPAVTLDFRDDPANPSSGLLISGTTELTRDIFALLTDSGGNPIREFDVFTLKVSGSVTGYIPLARRVVLALSARGGRFFLLDPQSQTIAPKRFFLGGGASLRGFREDGVIPADRRVRLREERDACSSLANSAGCSDASAVLNSGREIPSEGGEVFTLYKTELRFPLPAFPALDTGIFVEAGNLWLQQTEFNALALRYIAGMGIRYVTPIGPLAFDLGVNLFPDSSINEPAVNLHFSIGLF